MVDGMMFAVMIGKEEIFQKIKRKKRDGSSKIRVRIKIYKTN